MKAICTRNGDFRGLVKDQETYERLKAGEVDWKPHVKEKLNEVIIPYKLFEYLMELDKETSNERTKT